MRRSLLLATACTTAAILAMPLSPAIAQHGTTPIASESTETQTMADQYQAHIDDITFYRVQQESASATILTATGEPLPPGTSVFLTGGKGDAYLRSENGVLFSIWSKTGRHYIEVYQDIYSPFKDTGNTTTARIAIWYPDRSKDIIESKITIFPTLEQVNAVIYAPTEMSLNKSVTINPTLQSSRTSGTNYSIAEPTEIDSLRKNGWHIKLDTTSGSLTVTSPNNEGTANISILAQYPDGTSQTVTATVKAKKQEELPPPPAKPKPARSVGSSLS